MELVEFQGLADTTLTKGDTDSNLVVIAPENQLTIYGGRSGNDWREEEETKRIEAWQAIFRHAGAARRGSRQDRAGSFCRAPLRIGDDQGY